MWGLFLHGNGPTAPIDFQLGKTALLYKCLMSSIYCQNNQWNFNKVFGGVDAKRVAINHLISSNPHDTQWELYSYLNAASSGLYWKPWRRSVYLHHLDLKIEDFIQPWKLEPSSKGLALASVFMWQVGWSLALCVCLRSQRGCVIALISLHFHCLYPCSQCEEVKHLLLVSPATRTVLLQCHHPCREGHFPCSPQDKEIPGTLLCLSSHLCSLSHVFTCKKSPAHLKIHCGFSRYKYSMKFIVLAGASSTII